MFKLKKKLFLDKEIYSIDFNENSLAIGSNSFFKTWNLKTENYDINFETKYSTTVACSPNNKFIAFGNSHNSMYIINLLNKEKIQLKDFGLHETIYSPDSQSISSTDAEDIDFLKIYDTKLNAIKHLELDDTINHITYSPDGKNIALSQSRSITIIDTETFSIVQIENQNYVLTSCVEYSPDGKNFISVVVGDVDATDIGKAGGIDIYDVIDNKIVYKSRFRDSVGVWKIKYSSDGKYLASIDYNSNLVKIWDCDKLELSEILYEHNTKITCIKWSRNGEYLAIGTKDGLVKIWEFE